MKNSQKGFANIVLIVIVVAIVAVGGYFAFVKKSEPIAQQPTQSQQQNPVNNGEPDRGQGASFVPEADRIQIISPKGGEKLEVGKIYDVRWTNYSGKELLTIALQATTPDNKVSAKIVASNVPAASSGSYKWTVTSESPDSKYKIEVYPADGRELVGRSKDFFTIFGESLIVVNSPKANDRIDATKPIAISGKAKSLFNEGEFLILAYYILDGKEKVISSATATCNLNGNGCDWTSGKLLDFKATINLSASPVCGVNLAFYRAEARPTPTPVYIIPLSLYGVAGCL